MAINERKLANGRIKYEARLHHRPPKKSRCIRFNTREEAEHQIRVWQEIERKKQIKPSGIDFTRVLNFFLYRR